METDTQMLRREIDELRRETTNRMDRLHQEATERTLEGHRATDARIDALYLRMDELRRETLARIEDLRKQAFENARVFDACLFDLRREITGRIDSFIVQSYRRR